jgi:ABC-type branched-subunit amino acid transport system permease subunit
LSAAITAAGGCFYAQYFLFLDAGIAYGPWISVEALLAPIIGGIGTVFGPLLGALVVRSLGELTKLETGPCAGTRSRDLRRGAGACRGALRRAALRVCSKPARAISLQACGAATWLSCCA